MITRTEELREASGKVTYADPLTSFFYQLIRDELPAGIVEKVIQQVINEPVEGCIFTNGWLAEYAHNLAERLRQADTVKFEQALNQAFVTEDEKNRSAQEKVAAAMDKLRSAKDIDVISQEDIAVLAEGVVAACEKNGITKDDVSAFDEAKDMLEKLRADGHMTEEEATQILKDLEDVEVETAVTFPLTSEVPNGSAPITVIPKVETKSEEVPVEAGDSIREDLSFVPEELHELEKKVTAIANEVIYAGKDTRPKISEIAARAKEELDAEYVAHLSAEELDDKLASMNKYQPSGVSWTHNGKDMGKLPDTMDEIKETIAKCSNIIGEPKDEVKVDDKDLVWIEDARKDPMVQELLQKKAKEQEKSREEYMASRQVFGPNGENIIQDYSDPTHSIPLPVSETVTVRKDVMQKLIDILTELKG